MARIFISHSSANNAEALALRDWLVARGWDDLFLDIDPQRGLVSGQRWLDRLQESAHRCKAVLFVLSREWLASEYCWMEFREAQKQERPLFWLVIDDTAVAAVPDEMRSVWQLTFFTRGAEFESFSVLPPPGYTPAPVRFSQEGLESLRRGLAEAGLTSYDTASFPWPAQGFELESDRTTPRRPYRGLKPVDFPDAGVFFGRDADLVRAHERLADLRERSAPALVVVLGASGSGKSSFLRAGLLPRLARDDRRFLPLPVIRPRGAAMWGDEGLLTALDRAHQKAGLAATRADLRADLEAGSASLLRRLANLLSAAARGLPEDAKLPTLVIPIDQAEELFTTVRGDEPGETGVTEASLFLARLSEILRDGPEALALATIRSDAYEPLQTTAALTGVPQVPFNLPPLAAGNYRSVIEGPAGRATDEGRPMTLEPDLVEALLDESQDDDALPLLGFTLERLYIHHGSDGALTLADYDALGRIKGSIEAAVAEAFSKPDADPRIPADAAERDVLLKRAFVPHLMGVNEANGEPVRRIAQLDALPIETRGLINRLTERRLLVVDRRALANGTETVIEVAHEALLRLWPTLRRWHDQERTALQIQQEVTRASSAWNHNSRGTGWLDHRSTRLTEAEAVARREDFAAVFAGVPREYLEASRKAEDDARDAEIQRLARQRAMQRRVWVLLAAVAIVTIVGGWRVVVGQRNLARQESKFLAANSQKAFDSGRYDQAMRLALLASQESWLDPSSVDAGIQLGRAAHFSRLEAQLTGHEKAVASATFSPDGLRIVTESPEDAVRVWSRGEDGTWTSVTLEGPRGSVSSASFSDDGAQIVTAWNGTAQVWSLNKDGSWRSVPLQPHHYVVSAAFSRDGRIVTVATTQSPDVVRVWSQGKDHTWRGIPLKGHDNVISAAFSPDGARIATEAGNGTTWIWSRGENDVWTSAPLGTALGKAAKPSFSPDGTRIVTASDDGVTRMWKQVEDGTWTGTTLAFGGGQAPASFSPDGALMVSTTQDGKAKIWRQGESDVWASDFLIGHQEEIASSAFSHDGRLVTASLDKTARVWRRDEKGLWQSAVLEGHDGPVRSAFFSPDGAHIVTASEDGTARVWNPGEVDAWQSIALERQALRISAASFSSDGTRIVTASEDGTVKVWSRDENGAWHSVDLREHGGAVTSASFSPDAAHIVTASTDGTARVWSQDKNGTWSGILLTSHQRAVTSASFSLDGASIVTASEDGMVQVWRRGRGGSWASTSLPKEKYKVLSAAFSPDGTRIVTALFDGTARVWSQGQDGGWISVSLEGHQNLVRSVAFSPDGAYIVTASDDRTARVWSPGKGGTWSSFALEGHQMPVFSAFFSPDGARIVTASEDGTARVWSQGEDEAWTSVTLAGHQGPVHSASFSPDGTLIVTASDDGTVRIWNIRWLKGPGDWAKTEPLSLPETVCREKLHGSWTTAKDPKTGREVERIAERLLTEEDVKAAPILAGREGEDVCAPFLEPRPWWTRLAFWR